jgi:hypothetical protein
MAGTTPCTNLLNHIMGCYKNRSKLRHQTQQTVAVTFMNILHSLFDTFLTSELIQGHVNDEEAQVITYLQGLDPTFRMLFNISTTSWNPGDKRT